MADRDEPPDQLLPGDAEKRGGLREAEPGLAEDATTPVASPAETTGNPPADTGAPAPRETDRRPAAAEATERDRLISWLATFLALTFCGFPVLLAFILFFEIDNSDPSSRAADFYGLGIAFVTSSASKLLSGLLVPMLGAVTVFQKDKIGSTGAAVILWVFVAAFAFVIVGYVSSYEHARDLLYKDNVDAIREFFRQFLETVSLFILVLLGLRQFD